MLGEPITPEVGRRDGAPMTYPRTFVMKPLATRLALSAMLVAGVVDVRPEAAGRATGSPSQVRAGYIYNFAKLVEWPGDAAAKGEPLVIGVLGNDAFAAVLEQLLRDKRIDDRPFVIKRVQRSTLRDCDCGILFVASQQAAPREEILRLQRSASVLTIAESADFARGGGIVGVTLKGDKVRFTVNVDAASDASLTISSRLLALATIVGRDR